MKTKAVRIHGVRDLRLEDLEMPDIREDEILAEVITDSICMSTHKLAIQGDAHKRVRSSLAATPIIIGHEFCGKILKVGARWKNEFHPGSKFAIQPALNHKGSPWGPGYSYPWIGGAATHIIIPSEVMEEGCLLEYESATYFTGSLAEPMSCIVGAFHSQYHCKPGSYIHDMGLREGGSLALLASAGPMGLGAIDYALHAQPKPRRIVVADIDAARLKRAASLMTVKEANENGIELIYENICQAENPAARMISLNANNKYDDVFVFAPVAKLLETADIILAKDGCLNFFAGPNDPGFSAAINFYDIHYESHHVVGSSGGNTDDFREALAMMAKGSLKPQAMVTHVGGLNAVPETTLGLDVLPGAKKLIYTHKCLDLVALADLPELGGSNPFYAALAKIVGEHEGLWCREAEEYLLAHAPDI